MNPEITEQEITRIAAAAAKEALRHVHQLSKDEASNIALAAAKEAVRETHAELFALLGINIADFRDIKKLRGDLEFLGSMHQNAGKIGSRAIGTATAVIVGGIVLAIWIGFQALVKAKAGG